MILKMAFRNIFRHKIRTILTLVTMITAIFLAIFGEGFNRGMERQMIDLSIDTEVSHNKVYKKGFYDKEEEDPLDYEIENIKKVEDILEDEDYSKRLSFNGSITDGINEMRTNFLGVKPEMENTVFRRSGYMIQGSFLKNSSEMVIGSKLADLLNIQVGDFITIMGRTSQGTLNAYDLKVGGIIKTGNPLLDSQIVFLNLKFAKDFTSSKYVNDIAILSDISDKQIEQLNNNGVEVINWKRELSDIMTMIKIRGRVFSSISLTILLMAGVGITNTMLMVMLERKKEIGIMMANGMAQTDILRLFLAEGFIVGVVGSGLGFIIGSVVVLYFQKYGIPMPNLETVGVNFPLADRTYTYFDLIRNMGYFSIGIFISVLATFYPAYRASKVDPIKIIRD